MRAFEKIVDDYVRQHNPNFKSYTYKMEEIEKREALSFTLEISEQDKANKWID